MAELLGRDAIGSDWQPAWSAAIAGAQSQTDARRAPLAIRVAVDLIARAKPEQREALADEIAKFGFDAHEDFVARMYVTRIENHVRDPRAQKLAWPGLVVRRVTVDMVRQFLAPLCGLPPEEAENAFTALRQEVWMVTPEGNALRHRPDLRARTLRLMRQKDPGKFDEIAHKAVDYFADHRDRSPEDYADWIYHRLLAGEAPEQVEQDVHADVLPLLARAEEDFPPESPAASYLASRTARSRLAPRRIRQLRPLDALYHLRLTSAGTFALDDLTLDPIALDLSDRLLGGAATLGSDLEMWARALWIKTGTWTNVPVQASLGPELTPQLVRAHVFWAARIAPSLSPEGQQRLLDGLLKLLEFPSGIAERVGFRSAVQVMALARVVESKTFDRLDQQVAGTLVRMKPNAMPSLQAALRTAIVLGDASREPALKVWLESRRRGGAERVSDPSFALKEIQALIRMFPGARESLARVEEIGQARPARFVDDETVSMSFHVLESVLGDLPGEISGQKNRSALARVFVGRSEDWIVPFGYAAGRARGGRLSQALNFRLAAYDTARAQADPNRKLDLPADMLGAMRLADEAGDLAGFVRAVLQECDPKKPAVDKLRGLLQFHDAWSQSVSSAIGKEEIAPLAEAALPASERPPEPGPVIHSDDPQKERWGGKAECDGRILRAVLESVERDIFYFSLIVESTDRSELQPPVVFHLHDSYPRSIMTVRRIVDQRWAALNDWNAYGVFTVGAQVKNSAGTWISLEFDLATLPNLPERFLKR